MYIDIMTHTEIARLYDFAKLLKTNTMVLHVNVCDYIVRSY